MPSETPPAGIGRRAGAHARAAVTPVASALPAAPVEPRRSASLLLVRDDPLRVLMLRRGSRRGAFPSALVFPGGVLEPGDAALATPRDRQLAAAALRATAVRETWEEVGVLLARDRALAPIPAAHVPVPAQAEGGIRGVLERAGATLALDELVPFGRWITPVGGARRFDTDFFVAPAPAEQEPTADGVEAVALRWVCPRDVSALAEELLLLPTLMNLKRLGEYESFAELSLAAPALPRAAVTPVVGFDGGTPVVRIPESAGYGVTEYFPEDPGRFRLES